MSSKHLREVAIEDQDNSNNEITRVLANDLRIGSYIIVAEERRPSKILDSSKSKPGKHGAAKIRFVAVDLITNKKREETFGSQDMIDVPIVTKTDMIVSSVNWEENLVTVIPVPVKPTESSSSVAAERPLSKKEQRKARQRAAVTSEHAEDGQPASSSDPEKENDENENENENQKPEVPKETPPKKPVSPEAPAALTLPIHDGISESLEQAMEDKTSDEIVLATVITAMGEKALQSLKRKKI